MDILCLKENLGKSVSRRASSKHLAENSALKESLGGRHQLCLEQSLLLKTNEFMR
jgi:hypothetical protein